MNNGQALRAPREVDGARHWVPVLVGAFVPLTKLLDLPKGFLERLLIGGHGRGVKALHVDIRVNQRAIQKRVFRVIPEPATSSRYYARRGI